MSHHHLFLKARHLTAGAERLQTGVGRHVTQVARLVFKFCKSHGASKGVREFIENDAIDFAKANPGIVVYLKPRRHRSPVLVAEYLNGDREWMNLSNLEREEVHRWTGTFIGALHPSDTRIIKRWHTDYPSVQGPWCPMASPPEPAKERTLTPAMEKLLNLARSKEGDRRETDS